MFPLLAALVIAGCGASHGAGSGAAASGLSGSSTSGSGSAGEPLPTIKAPKPTAPVVVSTKSTPEFGTVLAAGPRRLTVYMFSGDRGGRSTCYAACARLWLPVLTKGRPRASGGALPGKVGLTRRVDGEAQVTYAGHPLYHYLPDGSPGNAVGQGLAAFGGRWYLLAPSGSAIRRR